MNYMIFAGETYYPAGGHYDIYAYTDTLEDAINYYYEAQVSGLHNCDLHAKTWPEQEKYVGQGNDWAHIYCVKTKSIIKKTDYTNKREEYDFIKKLRNMYRHYVSERDDNDDKNKEYITKMKEFVSFGKPKYIAEYGYLEYEIMYNLCIHKYIEKYLTKKQIKKKLWWLRVKNNV